MFSQQETLITWAAITLMTRRIDRGKQILDPLALAPRQLAQTA
ncbi:hypothetical protein ACFC5Z_38115 [Streptomyces sp. NPDC056004]